MLRFAMTDLRGEPGAITPDTLRALMAALDLHQAGLARLVSVGRSVVTRWLSGEVPVPPWLIVHLEAVQALRGLCELFPCRYKYGENIATEEHAHATIRRMRASQTVHEMNAEDFRIALSELGWRQADFARRVGCATNTASRWAQGRTPIPAWVPAHLALLTEIQRLHARFVQP